MSDRWRLFEEDFHFEVVAEQEALNYRSFEKSTPLLNCSGRGKRKCKLRLQDMRLPDALKVELLQQQQALLPKVGKGRARLLTDKRQNTDHKPGKLGFPKDKSSTSPASGSENLLELSKCSTSLQNSSLPSSILLEPFESSSYQGFGHVKKRDTDPKFTEEDFPKLANAQKPPSDTKVTSTKSKIRHKAKKKHVKNAEANFSENTEDTDFSIKGDHVCRIEGLPQKLCIKELREFLINYGQVVEVKLCEREKDSVALVKLGTAESAEWLVDCLDGSDAVFNDSEQPVKCSKLS
ncbi:uncharacterized protein LOC106181192 [Lingula anatina]|uniref:Uncharacterized protein LOC106181192 n=1 Tax=Lingula anatina TaxID=7574 RepID=A0A1S3KEN3_LINAN|nr:uncharacterized protein LOC106181192 [Lingula anatina]XP_013420962.1 uncharacterized protein LOC106181192 [Lingula anatina]|eukprot:XP_013420961.1 uncharacterized protein LOC106181192 [Lingula anatina]